MGVHAVHVLNTSADYLLSGQADCWDDAIMSDAIRDARKLARQDEEGSDSLPMGGYWGAVRGFYMARFFRKNLGEEPPANLLPADTRALYEEWVKKLDAVTSA